MNKNLYKFLIGLRDTPDNHDSWQKGLDDNDLYDLIKYAKKRGLIDGLDAQKDVYGSVSFAYANPRITLEGKAFIESLKSQR